MRARWLVLLLLAAPAAADTSPVLPPAECVRLMREARLAQEAGDGALALTKLREAVELHPNELIPLIALMDYHRERDAPEEEVARLRAILTQRLGDPEQELPAGTLGYLVQDPAAKPEDLALVAEAAERRLTEHPGDYELLSAISTVQERLELNDPLRATLRRMIALRPTTANHVRCLSIDREQDRWDEAAEHLRELLARDEDSRQLRMAYIEALGQLGDYDELVRQLDHVRANLQTLDLQTRSTLAELMLQVAWDLRDLGEDRKAETIFRRLLELDENEERARMAILYLYSDETERAEHERSLAERWSGETDAAALLSQGASLLAGGDAEGAFGLLQRAAAGLPDSEIAQFNLGVAAVRLKRWEVAESALSRAAALNPRRAEVFLNRGIARARLERCAEAVADLRQALALQADLTQAHYYLYDCLNRLGEPVAANEHLRLYNASRESP